MTAWAWMPECECFDDEIARAFRGWQTLGGGSPEDCHTRPIENIGYPMPQDALLGNPYEKHDSWWSWRALKRLGAVGRVPASGSTVALFSSRPGEIAGWLRGARLRTLGPLVLHKVRRKAHVILHKFGLHPGSPASGEGPPVASAK